MYFLGVPVLKHELQNLYAKLKSNRAQLVKLE